MHARVGGHFREVDWMLYFAFAAFSRSLASWASIASTFGRGLRCFRASAEYYFPCHGLFHLYLSLFLCTVGDFAGRSVEGFGVGVSFVLGLVGVG